MADMLLSALVSTVVGNLNSSVLKEFESAWGLRSELDKLRSTLSTIEAVLQDAEEKQWNDKPVRNWLGKLKDVAYDAHDVLDEFATEALIRKVEKEKGAKSKVRRFFSLRNRFIFRMKMAQNLKNVRDKLEAISKERSFHLKEGVINREVNNSESRKTSSHVNESEICGRGEEKEKMIRVLLTNESDDLAIYAVWGMAGLGKTALAQLVYNDVRVKEHFEMRIWVCVSDDFEITRLIKAIIESIDLRASDLSELDPLQQTLQEKLHGRRFLLVLDDVWNENEVKWNKLKYVLCCGAKGSEVIVTTRIEKIALMMATPTLPTHHIGGLSEYDSWSLFEERAFRMKRAEEKLELESIGKEIVKKCGGVPLAINALGSLLCLEGKNKWSSVKESQIWNLPADENSILPALRLSYHHLAPHMRQCFAYCCVFPKDTKLERDYLIQLWMALDFIPSRRPLELYDVGLDIFNELVWRSFFQDVVEESFGYITCKMHDLMHDLAQSIMELECLWVEPGKEVKVPDRIRHMSFPKYLRNTSWNEDVRKVRSLRTCIGASSYTFTCASSEEQLLFFSKQKSLRVWEFCNETRTKMSFSSLKHLRYLNLSATDNSVLPESITCLLNLQTLKLNCFFLRELPNGMKHMKNLMYLDLTSCFNLENWRTVEGRESYPRLSKLKIVRCPKLVELPIFPSITSLHIESSNAMLIRSVRDLTSLSSLVIEGINELSVLPDGLLQNHKMLELLHISRLPNLKELTNQLDNLSALKDFHLGYCDKLESLPDGLQNLHSLQELCIQNCNNLLSFPMNGLRGLSSLRRLEIFRCRKFSSLSEGIQYLTALENLRIVGCLKLTSLPEGIQHLTALRSLLIEYCEGLSSLPKQIGSLRSLSYLKVKDCSNLMSIPDGLQYLTALKRLVIRRCPHLKRRCQEDSGEDWHKIVHIPNVELPF